MKKLMKHLSAILIVIAMLFNAVPVSAASSISVPSSVVTYLTAKNIEQPERASIYITGLSSSQKVTASSVKSSKTSVASIYSVGNYYSSSENYYCSDSSTTSGDSKTAVINVLTKKAGTSTISFKIGSTTYTSKLTVKAYTNPVKSITITNVNSGSTFASKTSTSDQAELALSKTTSNAKLKVSAKSGWKIQSISMYNNEYDSTSAFSTHYSAYRYYQTPKSSGSLALGKLTKGNTYYVEITFVNSSNGGIIITSYTIS